jgi:hypothetical protein
VAPAGKYSVWSAEVLPCMFGADSWWVSAWWWPTCSLSVSWHVEAFHGLGVRLLKFQLSLVLHLLQAWLQHLSHGVCHCVPVASLYSSQFCCLFIFFCTGGISLSRGLCWFIPGVAEGYCVMFGVNLFGLLKVSQAWAGGGGWQASGQATVVRGL